MLAKGLCEKHYARVRRNGDLQTHSRWEGHVKVDKVCAVEDCETPSGRSNLCPKHYMRKRRTGSVELGPRVAHNRNTEADFWVQVAKGAAAQCWLWTKGVDGDGYGRLSFRGEKIKAHRLAFRLTFGYLPEGDRMVCHSCDNPPCCNPAHLYDGTGSDNMHDAWTRGRKRRTL